MEPTEGMMAAATVLLNNVLRRYDYNDGNRDVIAGKIAAHVGPEIEALQQQLDTTKAWAEFVTSGSAYQEVVEALCSKSWARRENHQDVLKLAKKLREQQNDVRHG